MNHSVLLGNYYLSLWEALIGLSFLVAGKVIGGYVMKYVYDLVREDDQAAESGANKAARLSRTHIRSRQLLWGGLAGLYAVSGLLQIRPVLVTATAAEFVAAVAPATDGLWLHSMVEAAARVWFADATASNIISVVLQWSLAALLWLGRERWVGRIGLYLSLLVSLLEWVFGEGFGYLASGAGYWLGSPGAALFYAFGAVLLLTPEGRWRSGAVRRGGLRAAAVFWGIGAALQVALMAQWRGLAGEVARWHDRFAPLGLLPQAPVAAHALTDGGVIWPVAAALAMLLLTLLMWRTRWQAAGAVLSLVAVFAVWAGLLGFGSTVHFAQNAGEFPIFAILLISIWYAPRGAVIAS